MKKLVTSYTFDASEKTIVAADFTSLEKIQLITNVTDQVIIYNFADTAKGGTLAGTTLTLEHDTTTMDDADKLQIFVEDGSVTLNTTVLGNVTLSDPKGFIGLVTVVHGSTTRSIVGNITLSDPKGFIGLVTVVGSLSAAAGNVTLDPGSRTGIVGNITLSDPKNYIGLVTVTGQVTPLLDAGSAMAAQTQLNDTTGIATEVFSSFVDSTLDGKTPILAPLGYDNTTDANAYRMFAVDAVGRLEVAPTGNVTLSDSKNYIGLVTAFIGNSTTTPLYVTGPGANGQGLVGNPVIIGGTDGSSSRRLRIGTDGRIEANVTVNHPIAVAGNLTLSDPKGFIGLVTAVGTFTTTFAGNVTLDPGSRTGVLGNVTLSDAKTYIGLVTATLDNGRGVGVVGNVTLSDAKTYIGLVTATSVNAGTNKTLVHLPMNMAQGSIATIAVPTNANRIKVTNIVLNSDATVRVAIKSGVTYLTGNATLGITLNPGGGFVNPGSPDSPVWIGLPSGAIVFEKLDLTATSAKIGGHIIYFDEA